MPWESSSDWARWTCLAAEFLFEHSVRYVVNMLSWAWGGAPSVVKAVVLDIRFDKWFQFLLRIKVVFRLLIEPKGSSVDGREKSENVFCFYSTKSRECSYFNH
jgi:hypothetical protein